MLPTPVDNNNNNNNNNNKRFYSLILLHYLFLKRSNSLFLLCREMDFLAHLSVYTLVFG